MKSGFFAHLHWILAKIRQINVYLGIIQREPATFSFVFMQLKVRLERNGSQGKLAWHISKYYIKTTERPTVNVPSCGKVILLCRLMSFAVLLSHLRRPTKVLRSLRHPIYHQITCTFGQIFIRCNNYLFDPKFIKINSVYFKKKKKLKTLKETICSPRQSGVLFVFSRV